MYSFGPLPKVGKSGRILGAHQKIDRVARRHFENLVETGLSFPSIKDILKFEGINGPDGVKLKSPGVDEPWHFIDPTNPDDHELLEHIANHQTGLTKALSNKDTVKAAFEAAWLAHAVVDGLTPAHHEPYDEIMKTIREESLVDMNTVRSKVIMPGETTKEFVKNNWEYWGAGGVMTTHTMFEAGVATTIKTLKFEFAAPSSNDIVRLKNEGFEALYRETVGIVAGYRLYDQYKKRGWTRAMAHAVRATLMPLILKMVVLAWYESYFFAMQKRKRSP